MEKLLEKLARQLDSIDEASLMALWSKYATITSRFEPTKRWEEACLVFSLIQAKHFKNQLFNYCWQQERRLDRPAKEDKSEQITVSTFGLERPPGKGTVRPSGTCRVLAFTPSSQSEQERKNDDTE